jgi:hypothetical protein
MIDDAKIIFKDSFKLLGKAPIYPVLTQIITKEDN